MSSVSASEYLSTSVWNTTGEKQYCIATSANEKESKRLRIQVKTLAAVKQTWNTQASQGQILALSWALFSAKMFKTVLVLVSLGIGIPFGLGEECDGRETVLHRHFGE